MNRFTKLLAWIMALVMTAALFPEVMEQTFRANCCVELNQGDMRGFFRMDLAQRPNAAVCPAVKKNLFKTHLFTLLGAASEF